MKLKKKKDIQWLHLKMKKKKKQRTVVWIFYELQCSGLLPHCRLDNGENREVVLSQANNKVTFAHFPVWCSSNSNGLRGSLFLKSTRNEEHAYSFSEWNCAPQLYSNSVCFSQRKRKAKLSSLSRSYCCYENFPLCKQSGKGKKKISFFLFLSSTFP